MSNRIETYNTLYEIELAEISLQVAKDQLEQAYIALADARREHDTAEAVLKDCKDASDDDMVEELVDEGFDYEIAEAIVRFERSLGARPAA